MTTEKTGSKGEDHERQPLKKELTWSGPTAAAPPRSGATAASIYPAHHGVQPVAEGRAVRSTSKEWCAAPGIRAVTNATPNALLVAAGGETISWA